MGRVWHLVEAGAALAFTTEEPYAMRHLKITVSLWLCLLVLTTAPLHAQQTHASPDQPTVPATAKAGDGWIGKQFARERPSYQGALSGLSKKTVTLPDKRTLMVGRSASRCSRISSGWRLS